ncbi:MAG: TIGR00300 family protein [Candidatus Hydrothermarchaeota archaeon]|nr:TIGR00300 family protein [Candidatus Hydrothermarchaeota archaeon]
MVVKEIELKGHIIDSFVLPKVFDTIMDLGGEFEVLQFEIGKHKTEPSYTRILVKGKNRRHLDQILGELHKVGATLPEIEALELKPALKDRALPRDFYSTTNHPTYVYIDGEWVAVAAIEMDCVIVVDIDNKKATCTPISDIREGDLVVIGKKGIRIEPPERPRGYSVFEFMKSNVSSEKPIQALVNQIVKEILEIKARGKKVLAVCGPAVVHTGASDSLAALIKEGFIDVLFAGNGFAVHDLERQLYGTSLGVDPKINRPMEGGHRNHLYTINEVLLAGSIKKLVKEGRVKKGVMYECIQRSIPIVLAGSIRDDGPLPEVITDVIQAQKMMRKNLKDVELVLMLSSMLHSIAVGNLLASHVKTVCVDINPATATKLSDRGTAQALGIVTDVGIFLPMFAKQLLKTLDKKGAY